MDENKAFSIEDELDRLTEKKEPGKENIITSTAPSKIEEKTNNAASFWGPEDFDIPEPPKPEPKAEEKEEAKEEDKKTKKKVTDAAKWASARTAVGMLDLTQKGIFTPLINWKYSKKFKKEEYDKLDNLIDLPAEKVPEEDKPLLKRFERVMAKREKKINAVPMGKEEQEDMEKAFYAYFDFKEKTLSPEWFVGMAIVNSIGKRTIDLVTE